MYNFCFIVNYLDSIVKHCYNQTLNCMYVVKTIFADACTVSVLLSTFLWYSPPIVG